MNKYSKLSDIVKRVKVGYVGTVNSFYTSQEIGVPIIRTTDLTENGINYLNLKYVSQDFHNKNKKSQLNKGDLIVARHGDSGKVNIFNKDFECQVLNSVIVEPDANIINSLSLKYVIESPFVSKQILGSVKGSVQGVINTSHISNLLIPFSKSISYEKIAAVLSALDDKIELNNRINTELDQMAKMLYDYWFVQFDFPNAEGKPYRASGGEMVYNEVLKREIPAGWENEFIKDLGTIVGGSTPSKAIDENFTSDGISWITPKDLSLNTKNKFIAKGELDITERGLKDANLNILPSRSVLMSSRAPVGYLAINSKECTTNQGFKSIVCNKEYSCEYVYYVLKNYMPTIEANATGSTFKEISASVLKSIKIVKPPIEIVSKFIASVKSIFDKQNNLEQQNQQLASLRDWLLPMLMNGQVTVGE